MNEESRKTAIIRGLRVELRKCQGETAIVFTPANLFLRTAVRHGIKATSDPPLVKPPNYNPQMDHCIPVHWWSSAYRTTGARLHHIIVVGQRTDLLEAWADREGDMLAALYRTYPQAVEVR